LGRWFLPIGVVAVAWVSFIDILLMFPTTQHVNAQNMSEFQSYFLLPLQDLLFSDYAVVIIMAVFIYAALSWVISARKWFKGPVTNLSEVSSMEEEYRS
jgi:hypothetical protein